MHAPQWKTLQRGGVALECTLFGVNHVSAPPFLCLLYSFVFHSFSRKIKCKHKTKNKEYPLHSNLQVRSFLGVPSQIIYLQQLSADSPLIQVVLTTFCSNSGHVFFMSQRQISPQVSIDLSKTTYTICVDTLVSEFFSVNIVVIGDFNVHNQDQLELTTTNCKSRLAKLFASSRARFF